MTDEAEDRAIELSAGLLMAGLRHDEKAVLTLLEELIDEGMPPGGAMYATTQVAAVILRRYATMLGISVEETLADIAMYASSGEMRRDLDG